MAAIVVSLTSALLVASSSCSSSSLVFTKQSLAALRVSFAVPPFCSRRGRVMAHTLTRATLKLTLPANLEAPEVLFAAKEIDVTEWKGDMLAVGFTEKDIAKDDNSKFENSILKKLDSRLGGLLAEASSEEDFTGKVDRSTVLRLPGLGSKRIRLIGLGQCASTMAAFRGLGEAVAAAAKAAQASDVAMLLASSEGLSAESKLSTATAIASEEASKIASLYSNVLSATILNAEQCKELKMGSYLGVAAASANPPHFIHLCYKPPSGQVGLS